MGKLISFMHMSLDGFVAGPKGEMDWIKVDEEIFDHVHHRIQNTDTAMYGRVTYEMMEGYWPTAASLPTATKHDVEHSKWYAQAHKIVLSTTLRDKKLENTTVLSADFAEEVNAIKEKSGKDILVFGSPRATHALIEHKLIDAYWLFLNPIILGKGIPLFKNIANKIKLKLVSTQQFTSGVTELRYEMDKV